MNLINFDSQKFQKDIDNLRLNKNTISKICVNFATLGFFSKNKSFLHNGEFKETTFLEKQSEKKFGILFNKISVYCDGSLDHGQIQIL